MTRTTQPKKLAKVIALSVERVSLGGAQITATFLTPAPCGRAASPSEDAMHCLSCEGNTRVLETRINHTTYGWVQRWRECRVCGHRFKTTEVPNDKLTFETESEDGEDTGEA